MTLSPRRPRTLVGTAQAAGVNESGAILMTTVVFQGMHTVYGDVEMCFWASVCSTTPHDVLFSSPHCATCSHV